MSGFKFHTSSRSDQESIKLLTFQDSYVLTQASSVQSALRSINKEDAIAFPLLRDGVQNNSIDWYSKYSGLQSLESFSAEEQQRIHAQYFDFRQEVFAKFSSSSSLGSLFREILPDRVSNLNEHGEAYFPEIWSNGSDFTLVWGIYRKQDEIIFPIINPTFPTSPIGRGTVSDVPVGPDPVSDDNDKPLKGGLLMLLLCLLVLIVMYFVGCHNCDDVISPLTGDRIVNPAPGILPPLPNQPPPQDDFILDSLSNTTVLNVLNLYSKDQSVELSDFIYAINDLCPDTAVEFKYWCNESKRVQIMFDHESFPNMSDELDSLLSAYDPLIWNESYELPTSINDTYYNHPGGWYFSDISFDESYINLSSPNIKLAIVDNGFDLEHYDLSQTLIEDQYNYAASPTGTYVYGLKDYFEPQIGSVIQNDHGSHVSGFCFATPNNGKGTCGISPNCLFMPIQVGKDFDQMMLTSSIIDGILHAIHHDADIINLSLGRMPDDFKDWSDVDKEIFKHNSQDFAEFLNELFNYVRI